jgi:hypothetical protein
VYGVDVADPSRDEDVGHQFVLPFVGRLDRDVRSRVAPAHPDEPTPGAAPADDA